MDKEAVEGVPVLPVREQTSLALCRLVRPTEDPVYVAEVFDELINRGSLSYELAFTERLVENTLDVLAAHGATNRHIAYRGCRLLRTTLGAPANRRVVIAHIDALAKVIPNEQLRLLEDELPSRCCSRWFFTYQ